MNLKAPYIIPVFFLLTLVVGCATIQSNQAQAPEKISEGYALLYSLLSDESDVDKVLIVKSTDEVTKSLIKEISQTAKQAKLRLSKLSKEEPAVDLENQNLPEMETRTRESISSATAKELLSSKDRDFKLRLLLTQENAMKYGQNLADTLAQKEFTPNRAKYLKQLSGNLKSLRERTIQAMGAERH